MMCNHGADHQEVEHTSVYTHTSQSVSGSVNDEIEERDSILLFNIITTIRNQSSSTIMKIKSL